MEHKSSRVLIVDDMPINRMIIASLLATSGVRSDQAESGKECIELCSRKDYDLILLDHRMPDLDGVDTFVQLKQIFAEKNRHVPVICHTTEEGRSNINLYKAAGFADVLIKPIEPRQLSEVLLTYLPEEDKLAEEEEALYWLAEKGQTSAPPDAVVKKELERLPLWLKTVPRIDLVAGVTNCETAEDYVDALYIFHASIIEKSGDIKYFMDHEDWTMYGLAVHSLKSMARLIGARHLSEAAADMEAACEERNYLAIKKNTPALLAAYLAFIDLLAPLNEDECIHRLINGTDNDAANASPKPDINLSRSILFIQTNRGIVTKGIENNLRECGFKVIPIPDAPDMIITYRFEADIVIYYPDPEDKSRIPVTMNLLGEICQDDNKILCLTGDVADLEIAMAANGAHRVSRSYPRPVTINRFLRDIEYFSTLLDEFHRQKTIFIVDDDADYTAVIEHWLSSSYNISCFNGGDELCEGLLAATPDLILMDYEMPGRDGFELLRDIRADKNTRTIPVIFLTGKNDRDHVFRILENKPDGYLLKTSQKETLLDAIHRFFAETMFTKSQG